MSGHARSLVLYYHRAASPECDPFQLAVAPDRLSEHLAVLARSVHVAPLEDVVARRAVRHREPRVAVTFDDGYADNLTEAAPRLAAAGLPATVFVTSSVLDGPREMWWDRLGHLLGDDEPRCRHLQVTLVGGALTIDIGSPAARRRALAVLRHRLFRQSPDVIDDALDAIATALGTTVAEHCADHALLSEHQLKELAAVTGISIGSHTVRHPRLSALSRSDQALELQKSRSDLETVTGRPVTAFAYPFGERSSYNSDTISLLRASGYHAAYTTDHGSVGKLTGRYLVPRYRVENWTGEEFERALRSWLGTA